MEAGVSRAASRAFTVLEFNQHDFETDAGRERIYNAAAASSASPLVFHPGNVDGLGPSYDGAIVNDTPIEWAAQDGVDRVVFIAPYREVFRPAKANNALDPSRTSPTCSPTNASTEI